MRHKFVLLWLPVFVLFCLLGQWQLTRYHYKKHLVDAASTRLNRPAVSFSEIQSGQTAADPFLRVTLKGVWQNDAVILVQNQFYHHRTGVEVLTPVRIVGDSRMLLVDRGWHAVSSPQHPPVILPVQGVRTIRGYLLPQPSYQFMLGDNIRNPGQRPLLIQQIDLAALSRQFKQDFYPFVLKLDPDIPFGFERESSAHLALPVPPERHLGYAFQWFAMAAVLFLACLFYAGRFKMVSPFGGSCRKQKGDVYK